MCSASSGGWLHPGSGQWLPECLLCVCCGYSASFAPVFSPPSSPLRATSSSPFLETSAWIRQPSPALPPCSSPLLLLLLLPCSFWLLVQPYFLGSLKSLPPILSFISISTYSLAFCLPLSLNQTVTIAWKQHSVTSWSGRMWRHQNLSLRNWRAVTVVVGGWRYWRLCPCVCLRFLSCSYAAPSSRRSARRKPNPSRPTTRWRRWPTRCRPRPNCSTTTGKAASPRCALLPPPQSEFVQVHPLPHTSIYTQVMQIRAVSGPLSSLSLNSFHCVVFVSVSQMSLNPHLAALLPLFRPLCSSFSLTSLRLL